jgi:hypothetical protein
MRIIETLRLCNFSSIAVGTVTPLFHHHGAPCLQPFLFLTPQALSIFPPRTFLPSPRLGLSPCELLACIFCLFPLCRCVYLNVGNKRRHTVRMRNIIPAITATLIALCECISDLQLLGRDCRYFSHYWKYEGGIPMSCNMTNEGMRSYGLVLGSICRCCGVWGLESDSKLLLTGIFHLSGQFSGWWKSKKHTPISHWI